MKNKHNALLSIPSDVDKESIELIAMCFFSTLKAERADVLKIAKHIGVDKSEVNNIKTVLGHKKMDKADAVGVVTLCLAVITTTGSGILNKSKTKGLAVLGEGDDDRVLVMGDIRQDKIIAEIPLQVHYEEVPA